VPTPNDKTELDGDRVGAEADVAVSRLPDATEQQRATLSEEPTEYDRLPSSEQPTVALPGVVRPNVDPPTAALPGVGLVLASSDARLVVHERTEPTSADGAICPLSPDSDPSTVAQPAGERRRPTSIPGYELIERLGVGTYGEVWLANDQRTGIRVAVKFLNHGTGVDWQLLQAEVKQLALLHADPGIVQLLNVELDGKPPYYVMAYAEQGSLARRLEEGPLPLAEAIEIFRQLAEALAYVHAKGVRHCDLKPGNILLKARKRVLIADFGQSHLSSEVTPALGTFFYMAPEQANLAHQIPDTRWDVYGLGAIFYAMLTGHPPRDDAKIRARFATIADVGERLAAYRAWVKEAPKPEEHRNVVGMDRRLAEIIDRCLEVNPARRLRDAGAVLAALARRERQQRQRPLLVFGFVAQIVLCIGLGGLGFWGVQAGIDSTEANLLPRLTASDPATAAIVLGEIDDLRTRVLWLGVLLTAGVMLFLSALWGWLIWTLRRKERAEPGTD
jgi:hypothetical protein